MERRNISLYVGHFTEQKLPLISSLTGDIGYNSTLVRVVPIGRLYPPISSRAIHIKPLSGFFDVKKRNSFWYIFSTKVSNIISGFSTKIFPISKKFFNYFFFIPYRCSRCCHIKYLFNKMILLFYQYLIPQQF